jgi:hypothetical protein
MHALHQIALKVVFFFSKNGICSSSRPAWVAFIFSRSAQRIGEHSQHNPASRFTHSQQYLRPLRPHPRAPQAGLAEAALYRVRGHPDHRRAGGIHAWHDNANSSEQEHMAENCWRRWHFLISVSLFTFIQ